MPSSAMTPVLMIVGAVAAVLLIMLIIVSLTISRTRRRPVSSPPAPKRAREQEAPPPTGGVTAPEAEESDDAPETDPAQEPPGAAVVDDETAVDATDDVELDLKEDAIEQDASLDIPHAGGGGDETAEETDDDVVDAPAASAPSPVDDGAVQADEVDCTAFAPLGVDWNTPFVIQAVLHKPEDAERARSMAEMLDASSEERTGQPLAAPLARGAVVEVRLDAPGLECPDPVVSLTWTGRPSTAVFPVRVPADAPAEAVPATLRLFVDGLPFGVLTFLIAHGASAEEPGDNRLRRYESAFISYATEDRVVVLGHAQVLERIGVDVFQDILDLEPGDRWEQKLFERIPESDVFLLYWSTAAAESDFVRRETLAALEARAASAGARPDIVPVILEGPPPPAPPEGLESIHFNDPIRYVIAAHEAAEANHADAETEDA